MFWAVLLMPHSTCPAENIEQKKHFESYRNFKNFLNLSEKFFVVVVKTKSTCSAEYFEQKKNILKLECMNSPFLLTDCKRMDTGGKYNLANSQTH